MTIERYSAGSLVTETSKLRLRLLSSSDEQLFVALYTDPDVMRHIADPMTHAQAKQAFARALARTDVQDPKFAYLVIESKRTATTIGLCAAPSIDVSKGTVEVGLMLLPYAQDRHLGTPALTAMIGQVFCALPSVQEVWGQFQKGHRLASLVAHAAGLRTRQNESAIRVSPKNRLASLTRHEWSAPSAAFRRSDIASGGMLMEVL